MVFLMAGEKNNKAVKLSISLPAGVLEMIDAECESQGIARSTYIKLAVINKVRSDRMMKDVPGMMMQAANMMIFIKEMEQKGLLPSDPGIGSQGQE